MFGKNPKRPPETSDGSILKVVEIFPTLQGEGPFVGEPAVFVRLGGCNLACNFCDTEFETFEEMRLDSILQKTMDFAVTKTSPKIAKGDFGLSQGRGAQERAPATFSNSSVAESEAQGSRAGTSPLGEVEKCSSQFSGEGHARDLVVITGGEPLRQNIVPLCEALLAQGFRVQIETNGTLWRPLPEGVSVVCSPKVTDGRYHPLRPDLLARVDALKFIVSAQDEAYQHVGDVGQSTSPRPIPIYVQPMDAYDLAQNAANSAHALALAQSHGYRLSTQMHKVWGIA